MIVDQLQDHLSSLASQRRLADVRIGLGYTAVLLDDGNAGVAYTFHEDASAGCSVFTGLRPLAGRIAAEALPYLTSSETVECTLGLAVANALANRPTADQLEGDILESLEVRPEDTVGMVGFFGPLVSPLRQKARRLTIFERNAARSDQVLPAEEAYGLLPDCDIAVITSTALIVGELDRLLEVSGDCREVALVGASTPLVPEVFGGRGVTLLSGVTVADPAGILQIVSEGGGMGLFGKRVRKVNVKP